MSLKYSIAVNGVNKSDVELYPDDTVGAIKQKIWDQVLNRSVALEEIYLWTRVVDTTPPTEIWAALTQHGRLKVTPARFDQFALNVDGINVKEKEKYTAADIPSGSPWVMDRILGQPFFAVDGEYPFVADPHKVTRFDELVERAQRRSLLSIDSVVLLAAGQEVARQIYVALAEDLLGSIPPPLIRLYWPKLAAAGVVGLESLREKRNALLETAVLPKTSNVPLLYSLGSAPTHITFLRGSISAVNMRVQLESIFKRVHATASMPLIKYTPAIQQDKMVRLYTNGTTTDDRKVPMLDKAAIMRLTRVLGKTRSVSFGMGIDMGTLHVELGGDGHVSFAVTLTGEGLSIADITALIASTLNPAINTINAQSGAKYPVFTSFSDYGTKVDQMTISTTFLQKKKASSVPHLLTLRSCLSSAFVVESDTVMRLKRVSHFNQQTSQEEFIIEQQKQGLSTQSIIQSLVENYGMDLDEAERLVADVFSLLQTEDEEGKHRASMLHQGFPVTIADGAMTIENVNHVGYLEPIGAYFGAVIKLSSDAAARKRCATTVEETPILQAEPMVEVDNSLFVDDSKERAKADELMGLLFMGDDDDDDDDEEEEQRGGKEDNIALERAKKHDPIMAPGFARGCQKRQPIAITKEELDNINRARPGFFKPDNILKYSGDPNKELYYVCPNYWDTENNMPLTEEEGKNNPRAFKVLQDKSMADNHYPGFTAPSSENPNGICHACCYKNINQAKAREQRCRELVEPKGQTKETINDHRGDINYILGPDKFPLPKERWGYLPPTLQLFFHNTCDVQKPETGSRQTCMLRHGVDNSRKTSFLAAIGDLLFYARTDAKGMPLHMSTADVRKLLVSETTAEVFAWAQNGSVARKFNGDLAAFHSFLMSDDSVIDYTFLWDIVCRPTPNLFPHGLNLVICEIPNDDLTSKVDIVCPTNHYVLDPFFDTAKPSALLYSHDGLFEPIYTYLRVERKHGPEIGKVFGFNTPFKPISAVLRNVIKPYWDKCAPKNGLPGYTLEHPIELSRLLVLLHKAAIAVEHMAVNTEGKIVGVKTTKGYAPCYPTAIPLDSTTETKSIDDDSNWDSLGKTLAFLRGLPPIGVYGLVSEDEMVVGVMTKTNQFVRLSTLVPVSEVRDPTLPIVGVGDPMAADKVIYKPAQKTDTARVDMITRIQSETQFLQAFRNKVRELLMADANIRGQIEAATMLNKEGTYQAKLVHVHELLGRLIAGHVVFVEGLRGSLKQGASTLHVPRMNLVRPAVNNEVYYAARIADELIRYKRMRAYLLDVRTRLPLSATNGYLVNDDEILVPLSSLTQEFFVGLVSESRAPKLYDYDNAMPRRQTLQSTFELEPMDDSDATKCEKTQMDIGSVKGTMKWKGCFPKGTTVTKYGATAECTFDVAAVLTGLDAEQARSQLHTLYKGELNPMRQQLSNVMADEGKWAWTPGAVVSEDYYLTPMDLWVLCEKHGINVTFISLGPALIQTGRVRQILATRGLDGAKMRFVFVGKLARGAPTEYHVVNEPLEANEINFKCKLGEQIPAAIDAAITVADYLQPP